MRRLLIAVGVGILTLVSSQATWGITTDPTLLGTVHVSAILSSTSPEPAPSNIQSIFADRNRISEPSALLRGYSDLTLSLNWPGGLSAKLGGNDVASPRYLWTLDVTPSGTRQHSLLRGSDIALVSWSNIGGSSPRYEFIINLISDGNWYNPGSSATSLETLGWYSTFQIIGVAEPVEGFQGTSGGTLPALTISGVASLYGTQLPTSGQPVIPDASTAVLLATGLIPVAALWRRVK